MRVAEVLRWIRCIWSHQAVKQHSGVLGYEVWFCPVCKRLYDQHKRIQFP